MTTAERPTLFELLPAFYRVRDAQQGGPLEAVLSVIEQEVGLLEADIERLYDNWFIETCDEWVVPYIGDLLGVSGVVPLEDARFSQRGLVANTIGYRRAKGTVAVLEQLARDVTGWPAKAVEYFQLLAATRSMNHERHSDEAFFGVRDASRAELASTPFDPGLHTADVRHIDIRRGRHNISNVGIHLWRLQPYALSRVSARQGADPSRWRVDPLGRDLHLFNVPPPERRLSQLAREVNVPGPLRRRPLHDELEALRQAEAERRAAAAQNLAPTSARGALEAIDPDRWFDDSQPVVRVFARKVGEEAMEEIPREEIVICNLSGDPGDGGWHRPATPRTYTSTIGGSAQRVELDVTVGVDPVLGRLSFAKPSDPGEAETVHDAVEVSYAYGFPGDLGGGPYGRRESVAAALRGRPKRTFQRGVTGDPETVGGNVVGDLETALGQWSDYLDQFELDPDDPDARPFGVIALMDSRSYGADGATMQVRVPNGCRLLIVGAGWPLFEADAEHDRVRTEGFLTPEDVRPHLRARFEVDGAAGEWPQLEPGGLTVDGILLGAGLEVVAGDLGRLRLAHCTLVPGSADLTISIEDEDGKRNSALEIELERAICGALTLPATVRALRIAESVVDGTGGSDPAIDAGEVALSVEASTVFGATRSRTLQASNSIFTGVVTAERRQTGCVRYSYLPPGSVVPRPYRCQPPEDDPRGIAPTFSAAGFGEPDYAQLGSDCPPEIVEGADDEAEMGAFHFLMQPQRLRNLTTRLDEYLRFGLEAGVFFVT